MVNWIHGFSMGSGGGVDGEVVMEIPYIFILLSARDLDV